MQVTGRTGLQGAQTWISPVDLQGTKQAWSGLNEIHSSQRELMYRYVSDLLCGFSLKMKKMVCGVF